MPATSLTELIQDKKFLLFDGATGSNYFDLGLVSGEAPELWNLNHPDTVKNLHSEFINAGSDIILTNSFGGNSERLKLHNAQDKVSELNTLAVKIADKARKECNRESVLIAGSVGPTGSLIEPNGHLSINDASQCFFEQIFALISAGADYVAAETISSLEETQAFIIAAEKISAPYTISMSFDSPRNRSMMGINPSSLVNFIKSVKHKPLAVGANCGIGPRENIISLLQMNQALESSSENILLVGKPNRGIPQYKDGAIHYAGDDSTLEKYISLAVALGVSIIGGCCGTTPQNLQFMRKSLDFYIKNPPTKISEAIINSKFPPTHEQVNPKINKRRNRTSPRNKI